MQLLSSLGQKEKKRKESVQPPYIAILEFPVYHGIYNTCNIFSNLDSYSGCFGGDLRWRDEVAIDARGAPETGGTARWRGAVSSKNSVIRLHNRYTRIVISHHDNEDY